MDKTSKILKYLGEKNIDAVIITKPSNMRYFTNYCGDTGQIIITKNNDKVLITDSRYTTQASVETNDIEVVDVGTLRNYGSALNKFLDKFGVKVVGIESSFISYSMYKSYKNELKNKELIELEEDLDKLRRIKTEEEIKYLEMAEHIGDIAFSKIIDIIKPGMTEIEIANHIEFIMKSNGALKTSFDTIVASGENSSKPHAIPSNRKVGKGDFITMDFGCIYEGYCSDMTRTVIIGEPTKEQRKVYDTVLEANLKALEAIKAGVIGSDIDKIARDIIYNAGYEGKFGHGLGHSVGLEVHENPRFSPTCNEEILENVIMTVEPGIYLENKYGVRIEDMILVTKTGYINFAKSNKELIIL